MGTDFISPSWIFCGHFDSHDFFWFSEMWTVSLRVLMGVLMPVTKIQFTDAKANGFSWYYIDIQCSETRSGCATISDVTVGQN